MTMTTPITTANVPVLDSGWSATPVFTVSGESLGNVFLHGNMAHIVPVVQPPLPTPPPAASSLTPETAQMQRHQYAFIGKLCKVWGRLVSLLDPNSSGKGWWRWSHKGIARQQADSSLCQEPQAVVIGAQAKAATMAVCFIGWQCQQSQWGWQGGRRCRCKWWHWQWRWLMVVWVCSANYRHHWALTYLWTGSFMSQQGTGHWICAWHPPSPYTPLAPLAVQEKCASAGLAAWKLGLCG